jgi:hypothetical protein
MLSARSRHTRIAARPLLVVATAALSALLVLTLALPGAAWAKRHRRHHHHRRVFYVSTEGSDAASGRSPARPWRTVDRVNRAHLVPGDTVLFHGGESFSDDTLMPGWGYNASGAPGRPITFGSYGRPRAVLPDGIWLGTHGVYRAPSHLTFKNLALGPVQGFQATADWIKLTGMKIGDLGHGSRGEVGVIAEGSHWVIAHSYIYDTGDSGLLLGASSVGPGEPPGGSHYLVTHDTIAGAGDDPALTYGTHGVYDKVVDARITHNRIVGFRDDGVSARYRGADVSNNVISGGAIGIAWFQYDPLPGTVRFVGNKISNTSSAGIFVCGVAEDCWRPRGHFVIARNRLRRAHGAILNLQPVTGHYTVYSNHR